MNKPKPPSLPTVKTLFAMSHNVCYYRGCDEQLTAPGWRSVRARVAHIRGEAPGSARYDPDMSEDERADFENLMLLCPNCHNLIDDLEPGRHTVEILTEMKLQAESHHDGRWVSDAEAAKWAIVILEVHVGGLVGSAASGHLTTEGDSLSAPAGPPPPTDPRSYERRAGAPGAAADQTVPFDGPVPFDGTPSATKRRKPAAQTVEVPMAEITLSGVAPVVIPTDVADIVDTHVSEDGRISRNDGVPITNDGRPVAAWTPGSRGGDGRPPEPSEITLEPVTTQPQIGPLDTTADEDQPGFVALPGGGDVPIDNVMDRLRGRNGVETQ